MPVSLVVQAYVKILEVALPITIVFHLGNLMVSTMLRAAFTGILDFRDGV